MDDNTKNIEYNETSSCEYCGNLIEMCMCVCPYCGERSSCECCLHDAVTGGLYKIDFKLLIERHIN